MKNQKERNLNVYIFLSRLYIEIMPVKRKRKLQFCGGRMLHPAGMFSQPTPIMVPARVARSIADALYPSQAFARITDGRFIGPPEHPFLSWPQSYRQGIILGKGASPRRGHYRYIRRGRGIKRIKVRSHIMRRQMRT